MPIKRPKQVLFNHGETWADLHSMWPASFRLSDEAYQVAAVIAPAHRIVQIKWREELKGEDIAIRDLLLLCWILRCQEGKMDTATEAYVVGKPMSWNKTLWSLKQSNLSRLKLIETLPFKKVHWMYRVTGKGKAMIMDFVQEMNNCHQNVSYFISKRENPELVSAQFKKYSNLMPFIERDEPNPLPDQP